VENKDGNPRIFLFWFIVYMDSGWKKNEEEDAHEPLWI
jgi:hypothetical protein